MHGKPWLIVFPVAAAGIVGFAIGRGAASPTPRENHSVTRHDDGATSPETSLRGTPAPSPAAPAPAEGAAGDSPPEPSELARRTAAVRAQARDMEANAERIARAQMEKERQQREADRERERTLMADAARGGTMAMMRTLHDQWVPPWELLSSPERFGEHFARKSQGYVVDGPGFAATSALSDGDTIRYPPGMFEVSNTWFESRHPFPKDLLVDGAGMDETVLVLLSELRMRDEVQSLTFRNLTLDCNDNYLEAMRQGPYTLRLDRCRVIGFDMGAGGSVMLSGSVGAFYATDCRFEACYGKAPGFGNLFDVRGMLLARMERCVVVGPFRSVFGNDSRNAQIWVDCRFERMVPRLAPSFDVPPSGVRLVDCTESFLSGEEAAEGPAQRPLTDINATWK